MDLFSIPNKGIPIGNLTSQIFANIYMNELDQFVKHTLKIKNYARYTDDFVIVSEDKSYLESLLPKLQLFLDKRLNLEIHPNKVSIIKSHRGVDFLGYVLFSHHKLLRTKTKRRIIRNLKDKVLLSENKPISEENLEHSLQSYLGVLSHANTYKLSNWLKNQYWFWLND